MARLRYLNQYQKGVMLLMAVMVLVFTVVYPMTIAREGFAYKNTILIPKQENGSTVYSGKILGKQCCFTVLADKTVEFKYGEKPYGPYTATEDPTAIPKNHNWEESMTGVELRQGDKILFRGGVLKLGEYLLLYNEDGSSAGFESTAYTSSGNVTDENGNVIDSMKPSASTIINLMSGPELTHKGEWLAWLGGVLVCIVTAVSILFADELFRWNLAFQIRNADMAEPSECEITGRNISWAVMPIMALILFIMGLQ